MRTKPETDSMSEEINPKAVCGNCGKMFESHYHEEEDYCFLDTTGDVFSDDPRDSMVLDILPMFLIDAAIDEWRRRNGHATPTPAEKPTP